MSQLTDTESPEAGLNEGESGWGKAPSSPEALWHPAFLAGSGSVPMEEAYGRLREEGLADAEARYLCRLYAPLAHWLVGRVSTLSQPLILGINGAQGTGKSTAAQLLTSAVKAQGAQVCHLSIDDLYLSRAARAELAERVHPLLATRGVPGTHDLALGARVFEALCHARPDQQTALPRFDKAADEPWPEAAWPRVTGRPDLIIFEGWCLGARPQPPSMLTKARNDLERREDPSGRWRRYVNEQLVQYQSLFARIHLLVMLQAPGFEQVYQWRALQESRLEDTNRQMKPAQLERFISHYERLTRWMLAEMPARADLVLALNRGHRVSRIQVHPEGALARNR